MKIKMVGTYEKHTVGMVWAESGHPHEWGLKEDLSHVKSKSAYN